MPRIEYELPHHGMGQSHFLMTARVSHSRAPDGARQVLSRQDWSIHPGKLAGMAGVYRVGRESKAIRWLMGTRLDMTSAIVPRRCRHCGAKTAQHES
jgi:hypothetical protein